ncbi:hypothetical protein [Halapricum salinum]|uniref:ABC-2 type transport system permease protein n=1 Tax=Halapricum salinum TaxID=1457250 RepID=A0A4D6HFR3_9EURY|nr:hypothetical protein [Halapricum salinum]QCC52365.1 hypothetical protein DV733_14485 [Halapricum salinum]
MSTPTRTIFVAMLKEEWRLQSTLFGGRRFAAFPLAVLALAVGGFVLLSEAGTGQEAIVAGLHALVVFFGLQVGTIGLVGRDAMRDVLGDMTLLVFSSRTLPITWRRLLAIFLVKDLLYYSILFVGPVALAYTPIAIAGGQPPLEVGLLWLTLSGAFALGVGSSLTLIGLGSHHRLVGLGAVALVTAGVVLGGVDPVTLTPYGTYTDATLANAVAGFAPVVVLGVFGVLLFEPGERSQGRKRFALVDRLVRAVPDDRGITHKALFSVVRSSGSVWKVLFSMGVLFGVAALLLSELSRATAIEPHRGIAFGALLGLGGFTTYAWLTQFEDEGATLRYPVTTAAVFAGIRRAYLALVLPTGLVYFAIATVWVPISELLVGVVVFPLVAVYVYGLTAYVAGFSPTELLFDTPLFLAFGSGLSLMALPVLIASLASSAAPTIAMGVAVGVSTVAAAIGIVLGRLAGPRWESRLRTSS